MIDANGALTAAECPVVGTTRCSSIRSSVKVQVEAYKPNAQHPFFDVGGTIYAEGHQHAWFVGVGTAPVSARPFWDGAAFSVDRDVDLTGSQRHLKVDNGIHPITITIPLNKVLFQHTFEVRVSLDTVTVDDRGLESAAAARIVDPGPFVASASAARTVQRVSSKLKAPPPAPRPPARCPSGPQPPCGTAAAGQPARDRRRGQWHRARAGHPHRRVARRDQRHVLTTSGGSARSGSDFTATRTLVRFENGDTSPRIVEIPIREDRAVESPGELQCLARRSALRAARAAHAAPRSTILDDDQPPPPPPPTFTIGGTVDGLQGSGLVLSNLGARRCRCRQRELHVPGHRLRRPALRGQRQDPAAQPRPGVHGAERRRSRRAART